MDARSRRLRPRVWLAAVRSTVVPFSDAALAELLAAALRKRSDIRLLARAPRRGSGRAASRRGLEFAFEARLGDGAAGDPAPYRPPGRRILLDLAARDGRTGVAIDALTVCRSAAEFKPSPAPAGVPAAAVAAAIEDAVGLLLPRLLRQAAVAMQAPAGDRAIATFKRRRA